MSHEVLTALLLGAGTGTGCWLIASGALRRESADSGAPSPWTWCRRLGRMWGGRRVVAAVLSGVLAGAATGWPVGGLLAGLAVAVLPGVLQRDRQAAARTEKLEAVAVWAEMLRDTLSAAAGLEQAILTTAPLAPPAVRTETVALAARVEEGQPLGAALRDFADDVADPVADTVVAALVMAAERQARQLGPLLGSLAAATREQVAMRLRIDAGRARVRTSVRVITATTVGMAAGLVVLNRPYLEPFSSLEGQLVLAVIGLLFAAGFAWLMKIAQFAEEPRILAPGSVGAFPAQGKAAVR
ncbi:type II secretion system F family protein [Actinacidiphila sp. bgisy167]|uniref:type II secretion system F family protein n=1 Tax=Actinacidiphila sp. bgisy167 TaxID=3413797 RepID=UPI003D722FB8